MISPIVASLGCLVLALAAIVLHGRRARQVAIAGLVLGMAALLLPAHPAPVQFNADALSTVLAGVVLLLTLCVTFASREVHVAYYASLLLSAIGMVLAGSAADLVLLFIGIELVTTPSYALVAWGKGPHRMEAAAKYFLVAIVASSLLLLGVVLLALSSGTTSIASLTLDGPLSLAGLAAVISGLGFKMGVWPFGFWIPDVYQGAPPRIAGLLAGASKKAAFVAFIRVAVVLGVAFVRWTPLMSVIAALTMTVPNLIALVQSDPRRMLAYSYVTHAGFFLMGLAVLTPVTVSGAVFHMVTHAFMALGAFLVLGVFTKHGMRRIDDLHGAGWRNPLLGVGLTLFLLSLAGIPLLSGFASKLYLFIGVASAGLVWLTALAVLNSMIALYYYFRIIRALYGFRGAGKPIEVHYGTMVAILICLFATIFLGIYPVPVIDAVVAAARSLF